MWFFDGISFCVTARALAAYWNGCGAHCGGRGETVKEIRSVRQAVDETAGQG